MSVAMHKDALLELGEAIAAKQYDSNQFVREGETAWQCATTKCG